MNGRSIARVVLGAALGLGGAAGSHAQDYPNRPVRVIVPFAPGGGVIGSSPQEFAAFIERDIEKWAVAIRASGARID